MRLFLLSIIIVFSPLLGYAQLSIWSHFDWNAEVISDSRAAGLGHTALISSNGANALFYNPGRMAMIPQIQATVGMRTRWGELKDEQYTENNGDYTFHIKFNHLALMMPVPPAGGDLSVIFGAGYYVVRDLGFVLKMDDLEIKSKGGYSILATGIGLDYKRLFGLGLAYNTPLFSGREIERSGDNENYRTEWDITGSNIIAGGYMMMGENLTIAVAWHQEMDNQDEVRYYSDSESAETAKYRREYPSIMGFGIGWRVSANVTLIAEYQTRPFSDARVVKTQENEQDVNIVYDDLLDDGSVWKIGVEIGGWRMGCYGESIFAPDSPDGRTPMTLYGFTCGFGSEAASLAFEYNVWTFQRDENEYNFDSGNKIQEKLYVLSLTLTPSF